MGDLIIDKNIFTGAVHPEEIAFQLLIAAILAAIVQFHFAKYGDTVSNRRELRIVIPIVCLTTVLVISVVKSSLALSLGLVGALSIVRFRTPIKEPEELGYLFLSIAIGLGLGAGQVITTIISVAMILLVITIFKIYLKSSRAKEIYLNIDIMDHAQSPTEKCNSLISHYFDNAELLRYGYNNDIHQMVYRLEANDPDTLGIFVEKIKLEYESVTANFVELPKNPGL